jgi:DNA invertase Pin-like site-specific DNA recombinase
MTARAIAYIRQSVARTKDAQDGGSLSGASQLHAIQTWCAAHDTTLVAWHQDIDESGKDPSRKGLDAFLNDAASIKPDLAIFWDLKRLVRNLRLFLDVFDALERDRVELVSCTEGTRHPAFVWKLLALMAEEELTRISQSITHAKREATKRGRHMGAAPLGYVRDDDGILQPDPATSWIITWMYQRAMEGHTPTAICRMANERGIPTSGTVRAKSNGATGATPLPTPEAAGDIGDTLTHWSRRTVMAILRRPTYTGLVQSGANSHTHYGQALGTVGGRARPDH